MSEWLAQSILEEHRSYWLNSGAPRSRTRTEKLNSTLLGNDQGFVRCPSVIRVGLAFGSADPLEVVEELLGDAGITDPQMLRERYEAPQEPCICRLDPRPRLLRVWESGRDTVLRQVLILALSTPCLYDPSRPLLLTRKSLTRTLELFDGRGFYA